MSDYITISRQDYQKLQTELDELRKAVATLREELGIYVAAENKLEQANKRLQEKLAQENQKPFKRSRAKKQGERKKRGRAKGHKGAGRKRPERIDKKIRVPAEETCPDCGEKASSKKVTRNRDVVDIQPIRPTINIRYEIERGWCPNCRKYHEAPVTKALPRHRFGFQVMLFVVYQKVALGLSYSKIQRELALYFDLKISRGHLTNIVAEVSGLFGPSYVALLRLMRKQAVLHIDETGWKVDGNNHWLWVFVNDVVTLFVLSKSRGSKVPKAVLGEAFDGIVISDFFSAYSPLDVEKGKCWSHLLQDTHEIANSSAVPDTKKERMRFHDDLHELFLEMQMGALEITVDPTCRTEICKNMRNKLAIFAKQKWLDPDCIRLATRILKHLDELVTWLKHPDVAPTNNMAERALRPAVVTRKTSFGSRSKVGGHAFARLLSIIESWDKQGLSFFSEGVASLELAACSQN